MGHYYWKDDNIYTTKQRAKEIKSVVNSPTPYDIVLQNRSYLNTSLTDGSADSL